MTDKIDSNSLSTDTVSAAYDHLDQLLAMVNGQQITTEELRITTESGRVVRVQSDDSIVITDGETDG